MKTFIRALNTVAMLALPFVFAACGNSGGGGSSNPTGYYWNGSQCLLNGQNTGYSQTQCQSYVGSGGNMVWNGNQCLRNGVPVNIPQQSCISTCGVTSGYTTGYANPGYANTGCNNGIYGGSNYGSIPHTYVYGGYIYNCVTGQPLYGPYGGIIGVCQ